MDKKSEKGRREEKRELKLIIVDSSHRIEIN